MTQTKTNVPSTDLTARYWRDGFVFPIEVMNADRAAALRAEVEAVEGQLAGDPALRTSVLGNANLALPFIDQVTRAPALLEAAGGILGPDLLVWSCSFFTKEAQAASYVSWHQDLHYWGLDRDDEVTAWLALTPATTENGCMRYLAGSHREIVEHGDSNGADNMLSRGQEVTVEIDEAAATEVILAPGQAALHHGRTFHSSHANQSDERRIGLAIRYIAPSMKMAVGERLGARLVAGNDRYGHFDLFDAPTTALDEADLKNLQRQAELRRQILFRDTTAD